MDDSSEAAPPVLEGQLELRAEQVVIEKQRRPAGTVTVRREVRTRQQTLTVDLVQEVLVLQVQPGQVGVSVDGLVLEPGETREIVIYEEQAQIGKRTVVSEQVEVLKRTRVEHQSVPVELAYEELDVQHSEGLAVREERRNT